MTAVRLHHVTVQYDGASSPALRDVDLEIAEGEFCLVIGPTGGGKSTFTQLISGAIPHIREADFTGDVTVQGRNTRTAAMHELATVVGAVFQEPEAQLINIYVRDELYFGPENLLIEPAVIRERARRALERVDLVEKAESQVFELSGGQKQKVALASVLVMEPRILVLDQPTANLDPVSAREVFRLLRLLREELDLTVVIIEHNVDELAALVDKVAVFDQGRLIAHHDPEAVFYDLFASEARLGLWTPQAVEAARLLNPVLRRPSRALVIPELRRALREELDADAARFLPASVASAATRALDSDQTSLVEVRGLSYIYETNGVQALTDVDLAIARGEFVAIIGRNGSGKSTLAKILTKILVPPDGTVQIDGRDINCLKLSDLSETIGYVFQNPDHQFVTDTVRDEVAYSLRVRHYDEDEIRVRVDRMLGQFGLRDFAAASPFSLSVGQRRLLSVATMLVLDQRMVILDEPTIGQDQASARALMQHLQDLHVGGKSIVIITHDMRLLAEWSERAIVMARSRVVYDGSINEVFARSDVMQEAAIFAPPVVELARALANLPDGAPSPILTPEDLLGAWHAGETTEGG